MKPNVREQLEARMAEANKILSVPEAKMDGGAQSRIRYLSDDIRDLLEGTVTVARLYRRGHEIEKEIENHKRSGSTKEVAQREFDLKAIEARRVEEERLNELIPEDEVPAMLERTGNAGIVTSKRIESVGKGRSYRSLFGSPQGSTDFRGLQEMLNIIESGRFDPRLDQCRAAYGGSTIVGQDGGYLVPDQLVIELFNSVLEKSIVLSRCEVVGMTGGSRLVSGYDESDRSNGNLYGFSSEWINEGEAPTLTKPKFRQMLLKARKLAILTAMTSELLADARNGTGVDEALKNAMRWSIDRALLFTGNGSGQPQSVFNAESKITVSKEDGQTDGTITYRNLSNMEARLAPEFEKAIWIASPSCKPQLRELSIILIEDAAAAHVPALQKVGDRWELLGRELVWSEHLPPIGTEGDLMLTDFSAYSVGMQREITCSSHDLI